ncbi:MAG: uroporphyrinogen decarboxylase family protein [Anaerolineales bacterium]
MNAQERFNKTMNDDSGDRPPLFDDGIRKEVLRKWHSQGLNKKDRLETLFIFDRREDIEPNLEPIPTPTRWPTNPDGMKKFAARLDPNDPQRLPDAWERKLIEWRNRDYPLILRVHRGYFLTMGVHGWHRFTDAVRLLVDDPHFVELWMKMYAEFCCQLVDKILRQVQVDAALFSEPIGGNHGPLISPSMYASIILNSYQPIVNVLQANGVKTIIYRTYANTRLLLPSVVNAGFNCLWACECNPEAMDYRQIRQEFGKDLRLIGGIDSDSLRQTQQDIHRTVMELVPGLLDDGGFIPLADGRVREDVPFDNYVYYRKLLEQITGAG